MSATGARGGLSVRDELLRPPVFCLGRVKVNFSAGFDLLLVAVVLAVACIGKLAGAGLGARLGGMPPRLALAVGFGMNARAIGDPGHGGPARRPHRPAHFVALVFMAIVTSMMGGPALKRLAGVTPR